jgi:ABC-2 type transport system ATP-binding protein
VNDPLVVIKDVSKLFLDNSTQALESINVTIPSGQIIGMAGPDGAGKTTLIRLIAGLLVPTTGSITVRGFDTVANPSAIHHQIGYMPQKFGLYEDLTVQQNLNLYADLQGVVGEAKKEAFSHLLTFTGLHPFTDRLAKALSGGMKQKLGLACSLIRKPALLLLDEPSVGVDPISRRELWKMVQDLVDDGISVVWSTAYLDEAERADNVLLLDEGKIIYSGPPEAFSKRVQGRTFKIEEMTGNRRKVLEDILKEGTVVDGVIQGSSVRIVTKKEDSFSVPSSAGSSKVIPVSPRFEDAFIDVLGGIPIRESELAKYASPIQENKKDVVEAQQLTKVFGSFTAADHITFSIKRGEIFGLLGPNGAGKSTTFKMLCGLLKPTSGHAFVNGLDLQKAPSQARSQIGYMAQKFSLYSDLSVYQNLEFFSGIYNLRGDRRKSTIEEMIEIFNLKEYLSVNAGTLPLGFKQRLALACSVMHNPQVLFLDEPTSGVDPISRREFWMHINGLVEKGVTIMVTTHFMDEAEYCDRIALVYRSKVINMGTPDALKALAVKPDLPNPTLEDAFIALVEKHDRDQGKL